MPSNVPVGQSPYIFDLHTHNFDGSLHRSRTHPLDPLFDSIDSYDPSLSSRGSPDPLCMIWIGLHFTHIACKILFEMSSTHIPTDTFTKSHPQTKTLTNAHAICLGLYLSHTHPRRWGTCTKRRGACTVHVLLSLSQPHPRGYMVELISVRKGSPHGNLTRVLVVH